MDLSAPQFPKNQTPPRHNKIQNPRRARKEDISASFSEISERKVNVLPIDQAEKSKRRRKAALQVRTNEDLIKAGERLVDHSFSRSLA